MCFILHENGVQDVNGGIAQNGNGEVTGVTIQTNGFSPFVIIKAGEALTTGEGSTVGENSTVNISIFLVHGSKQKVFRKKQMKCGLISAKVKVWIRTVSIV